MTLHLGLSSHVHGRAARHQQQQQQQDLRDARRLLKDRVRSDWDYPPLPAYQLDPSSGAAPTAAAAAADDELERRVAGFRFHASATTPTTATMTTAAEDTANASPAQGQVEEGEQPEWRERDFSSESSGSDEAAAARYQRRLRRQNQEGRLWLFEGPDSVGAEVFDRRMARKRRRLAAQDDESAWNEGLAHWLARRDLWCGAQSVERVVARRRHTEEAAVSSSIGLVRQQQQQDRGAASSAALTGPSLPAATQQELTPRSSTSTSASASLVPDTAPASATPPTTPDRESSGPMISKPISDTPAPAAELTVGPSPPPPLSSSSAVLIPVVPPILANHPVRRRITPSIYPEIYSKIILQSRTPSVPINLQTLTSALVQGWKDDGEWPPKPTPIEPGVARKKSAGAGAGKGGSGGGGGEGALRSGVRAVGRVLRITNTGAEAGAVPGEG